MTKTADPHRSQSQEQRQQELLQELEKCFDCNSSPDQTECPTAGMIPSMEQVAALNYVQGKCFLFFNQSDHQGTVSLHFFPQIFPVYAYSYIYIYVYIYIYICVYIYVYMYIYICIYMYICTRMQFYHTYMPQTIKNSRCAAPNSEAQRCHTAVQRMREPLAASWTRKGQASVEQLWALKTIIYFDAEWIDFYFDD